MTAVEQREALAVCKLKRVLRERRELLAKRMWDTEIAEMLAIETLTALVARFPDEWLFGNLCVEWDDGYYHRVKINLPDYRMILFTDGGVKLVDPDNAMVEVEMADPEMYEQMYGFIDTEPSFGE